MYDSHLHQCSCSPGIKSLNNTNLPFSEFSLTSFNTCTKKGFKSPLEFTCTSAHVPTAKRICNSCTSMALLHEPLSIMSLTPSYKLRMPRKAEHQASSDASLG